MRGRIASPSGSKAEEQEETKVTAGRGSPVMIPNFRGQAGNREVF